MALVRPGATPVSVAAKPPIKAPAAAAPRAAVAAPPARTAVSAARAPAPVSKAAPAARAASPAAAPAPAANLFTKKLAAMKAKWESAKTESKKTGGGGGTTLSVGRHSTRLTDARLIEQPTKMSNIFEFVAVDGAEVGEKAVIWFDLETEENLVHLQRALRKMGVEVDDLDITLLPEINEALIAAAPGCRISVKENAQGYINAYIDKAIEIDGDPAAETDPEVEPEVVAEEVPADPEEVPADPEQAAEGSEAPAEEAATDGGEVPAEPAEEAQLELADDVSFIHPKTKKRVTGVVKQFYSDGSVDIKEDKTSVIHNVDQQAGEVQKMAA